MKTADDLSLLVQRKTWGKELVLWVGSENCLRELLGATPIVNLDLLDLFDPDHLPMDDDDTLRLRHTDLNDQWREALEGSQTIPVKVKPKKTKLDTDALRGFDDL